MVNKYRTAIVTGASRGIGPYIANALAQEGLSLVLAARSATDLTKVANKLRSTGVNVVTIPTDVTDAKSLANLVSVAQQEFNTVDVLVNNAGGDLQREFHNFQAEDVEQTIRLNLTSAIELTRLLLPQMLKQGQGHIVNISSMGGWIGFPHTEVYSACKNGLVGFTRVLRADYVRTGISASVLIVGAVWGAGTTSRTMEETGFQMPSMAKASAASPNDVAKAVIRSIQRDKAEIVVMPGPGRLVKTLMDLFPGLGPLMNRTSGVADLMKQVADFRELQRVQDQL